VTSETEAERIHGPLAKPPFLVTDNGPSFIARRFQAFIHQQYSHVRIQYRTPQQLGLLERFHRTLKVKEVYWRLYEHPQHCRACLVEFRERYNDRTLGLDSRIRWRSSGTQGGVR
jgi:transposase InsO family protein